MCDETAGIDRRLMLIKKYSIERYWIRAKQFSNLTSGKFFFHFMKLSFHVFPFNNNNKKETETVKKKTESRNKYMDNREKEEIRESLQEPYQTINRNSKKQEQRK